MRLKASAPSSTSPKARALPLRELIPAKRCSSELNARRRVGVGRSGDRRGHALESNLAGDKKISTLLIIVILLLIFGGGGGYYAHSLYGGAGLGGVLGTVLVILLILWLLGVLR